MAYLRGNYYIWGDGENIHVGIKEEAVGGTEGGPDYDYSGVFLPYEVLSSRAYISWYSAPALKGQATRRKPRRG